MFKQDATTVSFTLHRKCLCLPIWCCSSLKFMVSSSITLENDITSIRRWQNCLTERDNAIITLQNPQIRFFVLLWIYVWFSMYIVTSISHKSWWFLLGWYLISFLIQHSHHSPSSIQYINKHTARLIELCKSARFSVIQLLGFAVKLVFTDVFKSQNLAMAFFSSAWYPSFSTFFLFSYALYYGDNE